MFVNAALEFQPSSYGESFQSVLEPLPLNELGRGSENAGKKSKLSSLELNDYFVSTNIVDRQLAECCMSGVWLLHDFLDESHLISQSIPTVDGSYWHAIMHRRESDYGNSKYWYRQVGSHRIFDRLADAAATIAQSSSDLHDRLAWLAGGDKWDCIAFVDACQWAVTTGDQAALTVRRVAQAEWCLLFDDCYRRAIGT